MPQTMSQPCAAPTTAVRVASSAYPAYFGVRTHDVGTQRRRSGLARHSEGGAKPHTRHVSVRSESVCCEILCGSAGDFATYVLCAWQCTMASGARDFGRDCHDMLERLLTVSKLCVGRTLLSTNSTQHGLVCANHGTRHALFLL